MELFPKYTDKQKKRQDIKEYIVYATFYVREKGNVYPVYKKETQER